MNKPTNRPSAIDIARETQGRVSCAIGLGKRTTILCTSQQDLDRVRREMSVQDAPPRVTAKIAPAERLRAPAERLR